MDDCNLGFLLTQTDRDTLKIVALEIFPRREGSFEGTTARWSLLNVTLSWNCGFTSIAALPSIWNLLGLNVTAEI